MFTFICFIISLFMALFLPSGTSAKDCVFFILVNTFFSPIFGMIIWWFSRN